ncbi:hypothetical protein BVRB_4g089490 [Beta vulgaris subsp. vulgaris]|uniref:protein ACCELERATED CELL DEATH 6-like n=1 Tax=Beta vulgaris subsp. vulgaris TaxID=3555 RepID=UPI00065C65BA|nr:protein ACCELERATED CELL DEATH 6-like [Beta vulgaris subsp. vulgaris]KMT12857.1 hypothetical protein BVRB_4g089490 [Beta vulgaris subsp. vulgaris]
MDSTETKTNNSSSSNNDNDGADELLDAAFEGRANDAVEILAKNPSSILIGDAIGDSAFHVAARAGHEDTVLKMIEFLNKDHLDILTNVLSDGNAKGDTPLHLAIKNGHTETAAHLAFADCHAVYQVNKEQVTPYALAQQAGYEKLLRLMDSRGARQHFVPSDIEMRLARMALSDNDDDDDEDEEEWIRLHKAAGKGKQDVIEEILEEDEDVLQHKNEIGCNALHVAAFHGQVGTLKTIFEVMQSSSEVKRLMLEGDRCNNIPLHYAIEGGHEKTTYYLVDKAPRAMYKLNQEGVSPLSLAVEKGHRDIVKYMTTAKVSASIRDRLLEHAKKISIAHIALKQRNPAVLQAIMEGIPELINLPDKKGWKLLSFAAFEGCLEEICYILKSFPDSITKKDEDGSFPIHKAVTGGHVSIVKKFILHCPQSLHHVDKRGRNVLQLATLYQSKDVLAYLKQETQLTGN